MRRNGIINRKRKLRRRMENAELKHICSRPDVLEFVHCTRVDLCHQKLMKRPINCHIYRSTWLTFSLFRSLWRGKAKNLCLRNQLIFFIHMIGCLASLITRIGNNLFASKKISKMRLWQDAENRTLLANLLKKNTEQRPKVLTVEDKLNVLGCKDLEKRIVEAEMDLTLATSQGYLKHQLRQSESSQKKLLAVVGVYTGFGSYLKRQTFRESWMPIGDALKKLEERVVIRFVIGRSANRGDSLDRKIDGENSKTKDFFILEGHEEAQEEPPKKVKIFSAVQNWDAEFYVKV